LWRQRPACGGQGWMMPTMDDSFQFDLCAIKGAQTDQHLPLACPAAHENRTN
jgi:hypothetical protein